MLAFVATVLCISCASKASNEKADETAQSDQQRVLVAYFSASDTTKAVAEEIAKATDGTLYEITPEPRYTEADLDWRDKESRSSVEMRDSLCRPEIAGDSLDIAQYDVILVGYPIWWDLVPRQVNTFLEKYDFSGKTLIPFATSGGSTIDNSVADLKRLYPQYDWSEGKLLNDSQEIDDWAISQLK